MTRPFSGGLWIMVVGWWGLSLWFKSLVSLSQSPTLSYSKSQDPPCSRGVLPHNLEWGMPHGEAKKNAGLAGFPLLVYWH